MYVATREDKDWLLIVQHKLYARSPKTTALIGTLVSASCQHLWKARCVTKGARRVRREAVRNPLGQPSNGADGLLYVRCEVLEEPMS